MQTILDICIVDSNVAVPVTPRVFVIHAQYPHHVVQEGLPVHTPVTQGDDAALVGHPDGREGTPAVQMNSHKNVIHVITLLRSHYGYY